SLCRPASDGDRQTYEKTSIGSSHLTRWSHERRKRLKKNLAPDIGPRRAMPPRPPMTNIAADDRASARFLGEAQGVDAALVVRAQSGDRTAEEAIYRRHVRYVGGLVLRLLGDRAEAEDCVQETFAIALGRIGSLRDGDALRGWIAQISVNLVRRRFRRRR